MDLHKNKLYFKISYKRSEPEEISELRKIIIEKEKKDKLLYFTST